MTGTFDFGAGARLIARSFGSPSTTGSGPYTHTFHSAPPPMPQQDLTGLCKRLEHYETDSWVSPAILCKERLEGIVLDPCCGTGIMTEAANRAGYSTVASDIHHWGYAGQESVIDFLDYSLLPAADGPFSLFINPPFSKAVEFVVKGIELGAEKIVCFQRFAWHESEERRDFFDCFSPSRVWLCGNRAVCWRHDLPQDDKGNRYDPETGKKLSPAPTAYAFFIWEKDKTYSARTELKRLYHGDAA